MPPRHCTAIVILLATLAGVFASLPARDVDAANQPSGLWLPWESGQSWRLTQGPHAGGSALDFQPPDAGGRGCDSAFSSSYWVVAAAGGRVSNIQNGLEIDHGNGLKTGYLHLQEKQVASGRVDAGDRLGKVSCCPEGYSDSCYATAPHLHFYTSYRGYKQSITGVNLEGWIVQEDGCLASFDQRVCDGGSLKSNAPLHSESNVDIVLVIDSSVSMMLADRDSVRLRALRALLAASLPGDRVGVVTFDADAHRLIWMRQARTNDNMRWAFFHGVKDLAMGGGTDIEAGLHAACTDLIRSGKAQNRGVILITDGVQTSSEAVSAQPCMRNYNWPVHTIGFGAEGEPTLRTIAADTGGEFTNAAEIQNLTCHIQRLRTQIAEGRPGHCATATIHPNESVSVPLPIANNRAHVAITASWPGGGDLRDPAHAADLTVTLVSPSGRSIGLDNVSADVSHEAGDTYRTFVMSSPEPGDWSVRLSAKGLPTERLEVTISLSGFEAPPVFPSFGPAPTETETPSPSPADTPPETPTPEASPTPTEELTPTPTPGIQPPPPLPTPTPTPEPTPVPEPTATAEPEPT